MNFLLNYPNYDVDIFGNVYKNAEIMTPFKSNKYLQVLLLDENHNRKVCGVHTLVAAKYLEDFEQGCVVHHKNHDTKDNRVSNLEVMSRSEHSKLHNINNRILANYIYLNGPHNKGKKMSNEFRENVDNLL